MRDKILTIAILSYKRPSFLESLLSNLVKYIEELDISKLITITIRINPCRGSDYSEITKKYQNYEYISINENEKNIGAIKSFYRIVDTIKTKYYNILKCH